MDNRNFKKLMVAGLACMALCGTTLAAPHGGNGNRPPQKPAVHQNARRHAHHNAPRPAHHAQHRAPAHHTHVVHHPAPPPPPPPPRTVVVHHEETGLGALLGALVGGLIGAAL